MGMSTLKSLRGFTTRLGSLGGPSCPFRVKSLTLWELETANVF